MHYCCVTSTQYGRTPLDRARFRIYPEIIEILKAQQQKLEGQTK